MFSGAISPCFLGTEKKFRLFLIFQRVGNPQKAAWLASYSITWAGPQRFGALLGTATVSSGARCRCGRLVSPHVVSRLGASWEGDCASELPAACSASRWLRSSPFWSRVKGSSALSGPHFAARHGHASCLALLHWQHDVSDLPEMLHWSVFVKNRYYSSGSIRINNKTR